MSAPGNTRRLIRQTLTIARRDFIATVFTPTFLIFLFAPVIMGSFGAIGGLGAASVADSNGDKTRIVAITPDSEATIMQAVDKRLRTVFRKDEAPPALLTIAPSGDPDGQAHSQFERRDYEVAATLYGPLDHPHILYGADGTRTANYLAQLADQVLRAARSGGTGPLSTAIEAPIARKTASKSGQNQAAFFTVFGVFFLTLLLAGQAVGTMAEERSNKVIEVLAAAVPLESVFLGKLLGMFGVAVLFIAFWGTLISQIGHILPPEMAAGLHDIAPAVGLPLYTMLFFAYFAMAYMLLGAVFLSVGAQASTMREIQMLSLPITIVQVAMFALASAGASRPHSWVAALAEVFPLSSPFAMAAHAANSPELWPHVLALLWQLFWVAVVIAIGARAFRRGVLQSGSAKFNFRTFFARS